MANERPPLTVAQITRKVYGAFAALVRDELNHVYPRQLGDTKLLNYSELSRLVNFVVEGHDGSQYHFPEKKRKVVAFMHLLFGAPLMGESFVVLLGGFQKSHRTEAFIRMSEAFSLSVGVSSTSHAKLLREVVARIKSQESQSESA